MRKCKEFLLFFIINFLFLLDILMFISDIFFKSLIVCWVNFFFGSVIVIILNFLKYMFLYYFYLYI